MKIPDTAKVLIGLVTALALLCLAALYAIGVFPQADDVSAFKKAASLALMFALWGSSVFAMILAVDIIRRSLRRRE